VQILGKEWVQGSRIFVVSEVARQCAKEHGGAGRVNGHIDWDFCRTALHLCVDWKREMIYLIAERCETTAFELNTAIQPRPGSQVNSKGFLFSWCWLWEVQNYKVQTSLWSSYLLISYANTELVGSDLMNNQMCLYYTLLALGSWARVSFCSNFVLTAKLQFALVCNLQEGI